MASMSNLHVLQLQENRLSGGLEGVFSPDTQLSLNTIDMSENLLTGALPKALFELPSVISVIAVNNCMDVELPTQICKAYKTLSVIALDGLSTNKKCKDYVRFSAQRFPKAQIPPCIFAMANLTTLHLSGNGLTGTLPLLPAGSKLTDISLAYNRYVGEYYECYCITLCTIFVY
jgi:hypothetical protein